MLLVKINTLEKENFNLVNSWAFEDIVAMELEGKQVRIGVIGAPCIGKV